MQENYASLTDKINDLALAIANEIKQINEHLDGPALFVHISKTLDRPPFIKEIKYDRPAGNIYRKTIVMNLQWRGIELVKEISIFTSDIFEQANLDIDDSMYNLFIPYHSVIYCKNEKTNNFDVVLCRKAYALP